MTKPEEFGKQMVEAVKSYVSRATAPLVQRLETLTEHIAAIPAGKDGKDGESVKGEPGAKGDKGESGEKGADGRNGTDGRDAAELDILPSIDESKSYRRGTWASHNGGLIRAERQTEPVTENILRSGWVVIVEGVSAIVVTQGEDAREIEVATVLTSGTKAIASFRTPVMIDRGVWKAQEFDQGDVTTWDGSGFVAQRKTLPSEKPGDQSGAWRMFVKRGRDGKDFRADEPVAVPVVRMK